MNSIFDFIVEPIGDRYNNEKKINNKKLILNTSIESFKFINKFNNTRKNKSGNKSVCEKWYS